MINFDRLTVKSAEAIQEAANAARQGGNPTIEDVHLLARCCAGGGDRRPHPPEGGGERHRGSRSEVEAARARLPKQYGGSQPTISRELNEVLDRAEQEARELKDEYVSTEHLLLGLGGKGSTTRELLSRAGRDARGAAAGAGAGARQRTG
jgi:ATP-dependent Clp protease ATP-binding subunit ClpB